MVTIFNGNTLLFETGIGYEIAFLVHLLPPNEREGIEVGHRDDPVFL
jgi:hypothetical protein